jgi:ABC-2 type transport system permease protein
MDFDLTPHLSKPEPQPSAPPLETPPGAPSPIADTTYRTYDGPLRLRAARWSVIALAQWNLVRRKPGFWVLFALGLLPYVFAGVLLYIQARLPAGSPDGAGRRPDEMFFFMFDSSPGQKYTYQFYRALDFQQYFLFPLTILLGSGSIAADSRTNALMVYLSKPLTKGDYLAGKWMGAFLILFGAAFLPALGLFLYALMNDGMDFVRTNPLMILRVVAAAAVPAALFASVQIGLSAWSKTPRLAGALFAGVYMASSLIAMILWSMQSREDLTKGILLRHLSLTGIVNGISQNIYGLTIHWPNVSRQRGFNLADLAPPDIKVLLPIFLLLVAGGIAAARARINAVEVVRG